MIRSGRDLVIRNEDGGEFIGFNLGPAGTAEHEFGIDPINDAFGIQIERIDPFVHQPIGDKPKPLFGVEARKIHQLPANLTLTRHRVTPMKYWKDKSGAKPKRQNVLYLQYKDFLTSREIAIHPEILPMVEWDALTSAWCGNGFGLLAAYDTKEHMKELWDAFQRLDVIIGVFGGGVFQRPGLGIYIASRIPDEIAQSMYEADENSYKLRLAAEKTGVYQILKEAGKHFFALEPAWSSTIKSTRRGEIKTDYDVIFFLNPSGEANFGWFTVEDLLLWAKDEGPIPKK